jgi:hypothetical protein
MNTGSFILGFAAGLCATVAGYAIGLLLRVWNAARRERKQFRGWVRRSF